MVQIQAGVIDSPEFSFPQLVTEQALSVSRHLVLAEARFDMARLLLEELRKEDNWRTDFCGSYQQLTRVLTQQQPDFLLLSTLEDLNWLEACRRCLKQWPHLPIILLVEQPKISPAFRNWVVEQGIQDVLSSHRRNIADLRATLKPVLQPPEPDATSEPNHQSPSQPIWTVPAATPSPIPTSGPFMVEDAIMVLNQISEYCMGYFGPLAIGNYWKKAYHREIEHYFSLQHWTVDHTGKIDYLLEPLGQVTPEQLQALQAWVKSLLQECQRIIVDFPALFHRKRWSPKAMQLLSDHIHAR